jgi:hypothetical protein
MTILVEIYEASTRDEGPTIKHSIEKIEILIE